MVLTNSVDRTTLFTVTSTIKLSSTEVLTGGIVINEEYHSA